MSFFVTSNFNVNLSVIRTIPSETFWFLFAILTLFFLYFFYCSYKALIKARTMGDLPTAKIRSAVQGYVVLKGTQRCLNHQKIIAPLSLQACTWYRCTIEFYRNQKWEIIDSQVSDALFELLDQTGSCIIDPKGAQVELAREDCWLGFTRSPKGKPKSWIAKLLSLFGRYRYHEWRMEEGMPLYAMGNFRTLTPEDPKFKQFSSPAHPQANIDVISGEALSSRTPFILSSIDEKKAIKAYQREAFIWFIAYLLLMGGLVWLLMVRLS